MNIEKRILSEMNKQKWKEVLILKEKLLKRLTSNNMSQEDIERIVSYRLERYYNKEIGEKDKKIYEKTAAVIENQRVKNEILREEVKRLSLHFAKHGVKLIHMKGITLAEDLYADCPEVRKCNDIDVLVAPKDVEVALNLLGELGYVIGTENILVSAQLKGTYYQKVISGAIHFPVFYVNIPCNGMDNYIRMDFHVAIAHAMMDKERKMNEMVQRCEQQLFDGIIIQVLEIHDRFIQLALHFTKEMLRNQMRWCIIGTRKIDRSKRLNLALLQDMALLIEKYCDRIKWDIIKERTLELDVADEIEFVIRCLKWMYPDMILPEIDNTICEQKIYKTKMTSYFYPIRLMQLDAEKILSKNMGELAQEILKQSENRQEACCVGQKYFINISFDNDIVGCVLSKKEQNTIGTIEFYVDKDVVLKVHINNMDNLSYFTFTIGSSSKRNIFNSYINKFMVNLNEYDPYWKNYTISINNKYVQAKMSYLVEEKDDFIEIRLPAEVVGQELIDNGYFLFDIDFPEIYVDMDIEGKGLRKFNLHSIAFPYSPDILQKIELKEKENVSCTDAI